MALRCSLTGHSWSDVRSEVDREEGLDEVAITEVEYRECERCGEVDVITENTEVTAMASGRENGESGDDATETAETAEPEPEGRHVATGDDAVIIDAEAGTATEGDDADADAERDGEDDEARQYVGTDVDGGTAPPPDAGSYRCPECGFSEAAATSSLRPGDLCPRCGDGYLDERE